MLESAYESNKDTPVSSIYSVNFKTRTHYITAKFIGATRNIMGDRSVSVVCSSRVLPGFLHASDQ